MRTRTLECTRFSSHSCTHPRQQHSITTRPTSYLAPTAIPGWGDAAEAWMHERLIERFVHGWVDAYGVMVRGNASYSTRTLLQ
jgi:hypothetical protein